MSQHDSWIPQGPQPKQPIRGYRLQAVPEMYGNPGHPAEWLCPRCGRQVYNHGMHLVYRAPCRDCRRFLRDQEGDETPYDRRPKKVPAPLPVLPTIDPEECGLLVTVRSVTRSWWYPLLGSVT